MSKKMNEFVKEFLKFDKLWKRESLDYDNTEELKELGSKFKPKLSVNQVKMKITKVEKVYKDELRKMEETNDGNDIYLSKVPWFRTMYNTLNNQNVYSKTAIQLDEVSLDVKHDIENQKKANCDINWTEEKILILIQQIRDQPLIWRPDNLDYSSSLRQAAYEKIAEFHKCSVIEIEKVWHNLFNRFWEEKLKLGETNSSGSQWFAFSKLCFLNELVKLDNNISKPCCRSCMKEDIELFNVFDTRSINDDISLSEAFYCFTGIQITEDDEYPTSICQRCWDQLEEFLRFKENVKIVQNNFQKRLNLKIIKPLPLILPQSQTGKRHLIIEEEDVTRSPKNIKVCQQKERIINRGRIYFCGYCSESFNFKRALKKHRQENHVETELPRFLCNICGQKFTTKNALQTHNLIHTGEKPFECKYCGKKFRQSSVLGCHLKLHTGKNVKCPDCDKTFSKKYQMEIHARIHTGERPYACTECDKSYTKPFALQEHIRAVHRGFKFVCEFCSIEYTNRGSYNIHVRTHTNEKNFKCKVHGCEEGFISSWHLKRHVAKCHN